VDRRPDNSLHQPRPKKKSAPVTVINAAREGGGETSDVDVPTSLPLLIGARSTRL